MSCVACAGELPEGAAFCPACGASQARSTCASCGTDLTPGAAFCFRCGTPVGAGAGAGAAGPASAAERRLTSVLFADLVSYTSLAESRDSEDVRALLSEYFDVCSTVVRRYGGVVEKFIGDAVMAVWGVPTAHEDDAERAVRAALELISSVTELGERLGTPELALRAGVVTGEVAANLSARDQGMVAGDPVNTAARVQTAAGPGEVWVDETTRSLTSAAVTYTDVGEHFLKGKLEAQHLYRAGAVVASVGGLQRVDGLEAPLAGRERELRLLKELFHATEESARPHLVVIDGEAGVGKTRLGWEFEKYVDGLSRRVAWHRGRCLSYGEGVAFWGLAEAVRARVGLVEGDAGAIVLDGLDRLLAEWVPEEAERQWLRPRVASLLGEESREFAREDLIAAWTRFFERIGGDDPVVLLIEDAQYADAGLLDFVEYVLGNARAGIFVLLVARPELLAGRPDLGGRRATPIRVEPLSQTAMATLLDGLVEGLPDTVRSALVSRAEGIPLYAVETVRALIDRDVVVPLGGRYVVAPGQNVDLAEIGAPASLHALIAARLDALLPAERRVVNDASVLGETFTREGIGILAADIPGLDEILAALTRRELIATDVDRFSSERGQYRFVQSVVRQVAYATLSRHDRKARHLMVAEHLAGDTDKAEELAQVVAQHLLDAAEASSADDPDVAPLRRRAGELLVRAATRASTLGSYEDADRGYGAALDCLDDPTERVRILRLQSGARIKRGRMAEALAAAQEAIELADRLGDVVGAGDAAYLASRSLGWMDRLGDAYEVAKRGRDALVGNEELPGARAARARLSSALAVALYFGGRGDEVDEPLWEALRGSELVDDFELFRTAVNVLAMQQARQGSTRVAFMLFEGLANAAREREDWIAFSTAITNVAVQLARTDLTRAVAESEKAHDAQVSHGLASDETLAANILNYTWLSGAWDVTAAWVASTEEEQLGLQLRAGIARGASRLCRWAGRDLGVVFGSDSDTGAFPIAQEYAEAARRLADGNPAAALPLLLSVVREELRLNNTKDDLHFYWPLAVQVAFEAGDDDALAELSPPDALAEEPAPSALHGHARVQRALAAWRRGEDAADHDVDVVTLLREAIENLDAVGVHVWAARAREHLGRYLLEHGQSEEAAAWLDAAAQAYDRLGALTWRAQLDSARTAAAAP